MVVLVASMGSLLPLEVVMLCSTLPYTRGLMPFAVMTGDRLLVGPFSHPSLSGGVPASYLYTQGLVPFTCV